MLPRLSVMLLVCVAPLAAQTGSDIYLVRMERFAGGVRLGRPANITERPGYDNQPAFLPDGTALLYTSIREDGQADTYRYDLGSREIARLTRTPESEYSPTMAPDGRRISVVRVERDSVQRLWAFEPESGAFEVLLPGLAPVGYYAWIDTATVAAFVLGSPPTLQVAPLQGDAWVAARDIGRTVAAVAGGVSFVQRDGDSLWIVRRPLERDTVERLALAPEHDFFTWTPDGALLAASGHRILMVRPGTEPAWQPIADFTGAPHGPITRLAVSPRGDWLAFVAAEP